MRQRSISIPSWLGQEELSSDNLPSTSPDLIKKFSDPQTCQTEIVFISRTNTTSEKEKGKMERQFHLQSILTLPPSEEWREEDTPKAGATSWTRISGLSLINIWSHDWDCSESRRFWNFIDKSDLLDNTSEYPDWLESPSLDHQTRLWPTNVITAVEKFVDCVVIKHYVAIISKPSLCIRLM